MDKVITFCQTATMIFQTHFFSDTCVKRDHYAIGKKASLQENVYSWRHCSYACRTSPLCKVWSYQPKTKKCLLKPEDKGFKKSYSGIIAGKKDCPK